LLAATSDREEIKALEQAPAAWQLSAEETQALETGEYEVRIVFDSTESGADEAYKGAARSRMLVVRVEDAPGELPEELRVEKALLESRYEEESDNKDRALEILDGLLGEQPKALAALEARADLLVRMERWEEALTAYDATLAALREKLAAEETRPTHPPALLLKKKNGVFEKLAAAEQASAKGPGVRR
jgi:predicted Zn-dependent protease